jgi:hypothetical protein
MFVCDAGLVQVVAQQPVVPMQVVVVVAAGVEQDAGQFPERLSVVQPPDVSYARSGDIAIAYQVVGTGSPDIVFVRGITGDLLSTLDPSSATA